jgi:hypothetical protein
MHHRMSVPDKKYPMLLRVMFVCDCGRLCDQLVAKSMLAILPMQVLWPLPCCGKILWTQRRDRQAADRRGFAPVTRLWGPAKVFGARRAALVRAAASKFDDSRRPWSGGPVLGGQPTVRSGVKAVVISNESAAMGQEKTSIARFVADQCRRLEMERFIADGGFLLESIAPYP